MTITKPNKMIRLIQLLFISIVFFLMINPCAQASVETDELASIQKTSKAFTAITKKVMPRGEQPSAPQTMRILFKPMPLLTRATVAVR